MSPQDHFDETATDLDVINELDQPDDFQLLASLLAAATAGDELNGRRVAKQMRERARNRYAERINADIARSNHEHELETA